MRVEVGPGERPVARPASSPITCSTWAWAPDSSMIRRSSVDLVRSTAALPSAASSRAASSAGARVERQGDQHRALALDEVVARPACRWRTGRRTRRAGRRAAGTPRRAAARTRVSSHQLRRAARRPASRRCAAAARWSTSRTCSAAPSSPRRRRRPPRACTETSRNWPAITSAAAPVEDVERRHRPGRAAARSGAAARRTSSAAGRRAGSPRTRRTARGRRASRRARCSASNAAVRRRPAAAGVGGVHVVVVHQRAGVQQLERRAGPHQRVLVRCVVRRARDRAEAPVAERRAEPLAARRPRPGPRPAAGRRRRRAGRAARPARRGTRRAPPAPGRGTRPGPTRVRCSVTGASLGGGPGGRRARPSAWTSARHTTRLPTLARMPDLSAIGQLLRSGGALVLVRVLPAQGRRRRGGAVAVDQRARAAAARPSSR